MKTAKKQLPFILLTAGAMVWLLCINLFQDGMFIDGIQYAAVARNLARGVGTFWNPVLAQNSVAGLSTFHEHPPLVFFIQAQFFKLFGFNNIYPERIYCLCMFLLTGSYMALIWRRLFYSSNKKQLWWLPVLLWTMMPIVFWAYVNDIQENTMGVFTTAAVYFFLAAVQGKKLKSTGFYAGCIAVLLAVLCKGVPGLFPLSFFMIYWFATRKITLRTAVISSWIALAIFVVAVVIILQNAEASNALHVWFFDRMLHRMATDPTETSHFYITAGLFTEQLPALIAVALIWLYCKNNRTVNSIDTSNFLLFLLLGLAASLPLMLTLVQRNFYFIPALPLFAIAWALLIEDGLSIALEKLTPRVNNAITVFAALALAAGVVITIIMAGHIKRDKDMLHDVYAMQTIIPKNTFVSVTPDVMWMDWSYRCYMMRYDEISFSDKDTCRYFIARKGQQAPDKFAPAGVALTSYNLYMRK